MSEPSSSSWRLAGLSLLGAASISGYASLAGLRGWSTREDVGAFLALMAGLFALYGLGAWACARGDWRGRRLIPVVLVVAALSRLALLPAGAESWSDVSTDLRAPSEPPVYATYLLYDHDVWRYLWDGRVANAGVDPYRFSPTAIEEAADDGDPRFAWALDEPWATVQTRLGYADYRTIYPPLAQIAYRGVTALAPGSVAAWKLLLILADLITCILLVDVFARSTGKPLLAIVYAWNPLVVKELAGSAHVDALAILGLVAMLWCLERRLEVPALAALAGAILVKLTPILIAPLLLRRIHWTRWWVLPAVGGLAYLPWLTSIPTMIESLRAFAADWAFNAGPWSVVHWASNAIGFSGRGVADLVSMVATLAVIAWLCRREAGSLQRFSAGAGAILGLYVLVSPTVMPWYLLWALPLLASHAIGRVVWPVVTFASLLSYGVYIDGVETTTWLVIEYSIIGLAMVWAWLNCRGRAAP